MKKIILAIAIVSIGLTSCKSEKKENEKAHKEALKAQKETVKPTVAGNVDITTSTISWKGTKPTGSHNGNISLKTGNIEIDNEGFKGGSFIIDMNSINTLDLKAGDGKEDLDGHLKGADFFDVAKFPTAFFKITKIEKNGEKYNVTGNLKVKDVEKELTIPATLSNKDGVYTLTSDSFKINRTEYGIKYKSKSFFNDLKEKFIHDDIELSFVINSKK